MKTRSKAPAGEAAPRNGARWLVGQSRPLLATLGVAISGLAIAFIILALADPGALPGGLIASALAASPDVSINSTSQGRPADATLTPVPEVPFQRQPGYRIIGANDLGMHCGDLDGRILTILPPFNVLHAQVLRTGRVPQILDDTSLEVVYSAASNPLDPALANTPVLAPNGSVYKTGFWDTARPAFKAFYPSGVLPLFYPYAPQVNFRDLGLPVVDTETLYLGSGALSVWQQPMPSVERFDIDPSSHAPTVVQSAPYAANVPQAFRQFEHDLPVFTSFPFGYVASKVNWFSAEGIPITTFDDFGRENPFPLMRIQARDKATGAVLSSLDVTIPVSSETDCKSCHLPSPDGNGLATDRLTAAGLLPAIPEQDPKLGRVPTEVSEEWAADINILRLHDLLSGTSLDAGYKPGSGISPKPVVCQTCHYTPALDLAQFGPQTAHGLTQSAAGSMSRVIHDYHARLTSGGKPVFPTMPPPDDPRRTKNQDAKPVNAFEQAKLEATCYQCHPGRRTQCLRGAMYSGAGTVCQDCHGQMAQVGDDFSRNKPGGGFIVRADYYTRAATPRVPWLNEPGCGSCHTGDAVDNMTGLPGVLTAADNLRLVQAYLSTDPAAKPIVPTNLRFAEPRVASGPAAGNPQLFRLSVDSHGGIFCEGCHGSTHAEWPNAIVKANDNIAAKQLQGHAGLVMECGTCHTGGLGTTLDGPHGMHPVGNAGTGGYSAAWTRAHGDFVERNGTAACATCHGTAGEGTALAEVRVARAGLECHQGALCPGWEGTITLTAGTQVACNACHENPFRGQ